MTKRGRSKLIVLIIVVVLTLFLVLQNTEMDKFEVLFWTLPMPRFVLLLVTFLFGILTGLIGFGYASRRK